MKVFEIYDSKAEAYSIPMYFPNRGLALRTFGELSNDPKSKLFLYPADFTFFEVGDYDERTGVHDSYESKYSLGTALMFKREQEPLAAPDISNEPVLQEIVKEVQGGKA